MNTWLWLMAAGSVLIFTLYGLRCAKAVHFPELRRHAWKTAVLSLAFSVLFGTVLARIGYALLMQELDFEYEGIDALSRLLEFEIETVSFLFGALGTVLGVLFANRLTRKSSAIAGMDAFAPFGALLAALFRLGELFFGSYGAGGSLPEGSPLAFFPLALKIEVAGGYTYWAWAVCILSAVFALVWAGIAFFRLRGKDRTGYCFTLTLFFLALPQVLCESLRHNVSMLWLFVHVEELLCVIVMLGIMLFWILKCGKNLSFQRRWGPLGILILGTGLLVAVEFAIDGKYFGLPVLLCYLIMCTVLVVIGWAGVIASRHWNTGNLQNFTD